MTNANGNTYLHQKWNQRGQNRGDNYDPRILEARKKLPIWQGKQTIVEAVQKNDTVIILGETGCGKTTQIPQFLYEAGFTTTCGNSSNVDINGDSSIGITQPRRVAAMSLAKRIAVEMGVSEPSRDERKTKKLSSLVGYSIRFDDRSGRNTRIRFMTDGWLLREMLEVKGKGKEKSRDAERTEMELDDGEVKLQHSLLERFSVLIIDEAHERSVHTDVVLGLAKKIQRERKRIRADWLKNQKSGIILAENSSQEPIELKLVIMSATIDAESFAKFFSDEKSEPAPILYIKGRQYPISLMHSLELCTDWMDSCKKLIVQINDLPPGDVLVFMTGAEEIDTLASDLQHLNDGLILYAEGLGAPNPMKLVVVKLYAALGSEAIRKCFHPTPPGSRKIVLATNIAETSITISGIKYVIDCGLAKERTFSANSKVSGSGLSGGSMDMLQIKEISKSAARQRAGRAGRESGGTCFRLYKEETFDALEESTLPEILRTDLSSVILDVFAMGLDPITFDWLDRPREENFEAAVLNLIELGALEMMQKSSPSSSSIQRVPGLKLTPLGLQMSKLPLSPQLSKTLLSARDCKDDRVFSQALDLVSILSTERKSILIEPTSRTSDEASDRKREEADRARERLSHPSGDHATQLRALAAFLHVEFDESQNTSTKSVKKNGRASSSSNDKLQEWCSINFVSIKTVREAMRIRAQIEQICIRQEWIRPNSARISHRWKVVEGNLSDESETSQDSQGKMTVYRGSINGYENGIESNDDYALLRKCLVQGKRNNTAFKEEGRNEYQRAHGGDERFKIHPSSSLHFRKPLPSVIVFEEIFVTSEIFARTVSVAEPAWLSEISGGITNQKSLSSQRTSCTL